MFPPLALTVVEELAALVMPYSEAVVYCAQVEYTLPKRIEVIAAVLDHSPATIP
jgi:hypothetical protein